jgi:hypothetical protein
MVEVLQLLRPGAIAWDQPAQAGGLGQAFGPVETLVEALRPVRP